MYSGKIAVPPGGGGIVNEIPSTRYIHRITNVIEEALEERETCSAVFPDVAQAFDKIWHKRVICKLNKILPKQYVHLSESYVTRRIFPVKKKTSTFSSRK
jgi:hypothetical protein